MGKMTLNCSISKGVRPVQSEHAVKMSQVCNDSKLKSYYLHHVLELCRVGLSRAFIQDLTNIRHVDELYQIDLEEVFNTTAIGQ